MRDSLGRFKSNPKAKFPVITGDCAYCGRTKAPQARCCMKCRPMRNAAKLSTRFWSKVYKTKSCWLWIANTNRLGYGHFDVARKRWRAHRFSFYLAHGPIPSGKIILHTCDTPGCVRPSHLRLGTISDNMKDFCSKGMIIPGNGRAL